ncbi:phage terminase large subunit family protein [Duganella phyllosphaerae]|uniref:Phage terminase large subunit (GpA) n=1 Tax=Duganella phyllosphaerae TaxID=762836 RepID=A0A1E7WZI6_9BURK|nr:phage terminase large subunit family protein [Duganella phyllosphaerae]OFA05181.1 phage terminase large subunit (GpA) [Duganella phyllosphaerae]
MGATDEFLRAIGEAILPDSKQSISDWAQDNRILPPDSPEPGAWRNNRTPYLVGIMDALSPSSKYREVYLKKGHQLGGSALGENFIGHSITSAAGNILAVFATVEDAEKWELSRFEPMRESTKALRKRVLDAGIKGADNTKRRKKFPGGFIQLIGANRPGGLKSSTMRYVLLEEMDEYAGDIGNQGSPEELARKRTSNFGKKARIFGNSTPTIKGASAIDRNYERGDKQHYMVHCPDCRASQYFKWSNMKWPKGQPEKVAYACDCCGALNTESAWKTKGYINAHWLPTAVGEPGVASFHLPSMYAPLGWRAWSVLASEFESAANDPVALKVFVNNELAECWEDLSGQIKGAEIAKRREGYELRSIPVGCLALVMSVDVQGNRLEYKVLGFGRGKRHWVIDYNVIDGDPAKSDVWDRLTAIRERPIENSFGVSMRVQTCAIDSGGHHTHEVYHYARLHRHAGVFAVKGSSQPGKPVIGRPSTQDVNHKGKTIKGGVQLWMVGGDTAKSLLFNYLASDEEAVPEERFIHFPMGLSDEYFEQLTAEVYDSTKKTYRKLAGRSNEVIDLFVYGFAAAFHPLLRLDTMRDADWTQLESLVEPVIGDLFRAPLALSAAATAPESSTEQPTAPVQTSAQTITPAPPVVQHHDDDWLSGTDNWLE